MEMSMIDQRLMWNDGCKMLGPPRYAAANRERLNKLKIWRSGIIMITRVFAFKCLPAKF